MHSYRIFQLTIFRYLFVGVINTIIGFGIIFLLMFFGKSPEISNMTGYSIGIIISYFFNKFFTFKNIKRNRFEFIKFITVMFISYIFNFMILKLCLYIEINKYIAQIIAGVFYTISGFIMSKFLVFK